LPFFSYCLPPTLIEITGVIRFEKNLNYLNWFGKYQ
jgi:hypothetical protein